MLVKFHRNCYLDRLYEIENNPHLLDEIWRDRLPRDAQIIETAEVKVPKTQKAVAFSELQNQKKVSMVDHLKTVEPKNED